MASPNGLASGEASTIETIIASAKQFAKSSTESGRKQLIDAFRDIAISLEDTQDSAMRLMYSQYQLMAVRFGCDIDLFNALKNADGPLTVAQLAEKTGTDPDLLGHFLRYMASVRIVKETDVDTFAANNVSLTFTNPGFAGGAYHYFDYMGPGTKHLPDYLRERSYQSPTSVKESPLLKAWGSKDLYMFEHYQTQPEIFKHFNHFMVAQRLGMPTWLDAYPYKEAAAAVKSPNQVFFVDIGGGFGHMSIALREALPNLPNKIIVQDVASLLASNPMSHPGVEFMAQDYFEPQQVKGAKIYYMRNIMHDHPDETAIRILKRTRDAIEPGSDGVILIDDMYLDEKQQHWHATQIDLTMMIAFSAKERKASEWQRLIPQAGLRIRNIYRYTESLRDSIIECVPA